MRIRRGLKITKVMVITLFIHKKWHEMLTSSKWGLMVSENMFRDMRRNVLAYRRDTQERTRCKWLAHWAWFQQSNQRGTAWGETPRQGGNLLGSNLADRHGGSVQVCLHTSVMAAICVVTATSLQTYYITYKVKVTTHS